MSPFKIKVPIQVPNNVTGYVPPFFEVKAVDVKFDVNVFVKKLSMLSFQYYPIQSQISRIRNYPPFPEKSIKFLTFCLCRLNESH